MTAERVDKGWTKDGLSKYSTEAILGSLQHYGADVPDAAAFKQLAGERFPLEVAEDVVRTWKGKGPWARFPLLAVDELYGRLFPERFAPGAYGTVLVELMEALGRMLEGAQDAPVGQKLKALEALKPKVPLKDGKPDDRWVNELLWRIGDWRKVMGRIAQDLAKDGHVDDAEEFVALEEFLVPDWAGTTRSLVRAIKGERPQAIEELKKVAGDAARLGEARTGALDCLLQLDALDEAEAAAGPLLDEAEKKEDFHFALDVGQRLAFIYEKKHDLAAMRALRERLQKVQEAHAKAHPDHHG